MARQRREAADRQADSTRQANQRVQPVAEDDPVLEEVAKNVETFKGLYKRTDDEYLAPMASPDIPAFLQLGREDRAISTRTEGCPPTH